MKIDLYNFTPYEVVAQVIDVMLRVDRAIEVATYYQNVVEHYIKNVPAESRNISFHVSRGTSRDRESNTNFIDRALKGICEISNEKLRNTSIARIAELHNSFISAMVEPYKSQCLQALMAQFGMIPMLMPESSDMEDTKLFTQFTANTGKSLTIFAYMMENNMLDPSDIEHKPEFMASLAELKKDIDVVMGTVNEKVTDNVRDIK